jgi:hypothetical protein
MLDNACHLLAFISNALLITIIIIIIIMNEIF